jgi:hypothetical protein
MYSLPFKLTFDNGATTGDANFLNIQPVLAVTRGDWNLVSRFIIPLADAPGGIPGLPDNPVSAIRRRAAALPVWATSTTPCSSIRWRRKAR